MRGHTAGSCGHPLVLPVGKEAKKCQRRPGVATLRAKHSWRTHYRGKTHGEAPKVSRLRPPGGSAGCRRCSLSHWSPHCFSLVLSLPTGLLAGWGRGGAQALPSLGNRVIRTPQASPLLRGFWPRCWDWHPSKVGAGECGRHRVGSWPLSVAVQKLLGVSGRY